MTHADAFGAKVIARRSCYRRKRWDALDDRDAGLPDFTNFLGIVCHETHRSYTEMLKNLNCKIVTAGVDRQAQPHICIYGVRARVLQRVGANLVEDSDSAAFLKKIDYGAAIRRCNAP